MKKVIEFILKYKIYFVTNVLYFIMLIFLFKKISLFWGVIISGIGLIYINLFLFINSRKQFNVNTIFLLLAIPLGCLMLVAIPLGNIPDERAHLARAYEISDFHIFSEINEENTTCGRVLPEEIYKLNGFNYTYEETKNNLFSKSNKKEFVAFPNTSLYSPISYAPQIIGISIGKVLNLPVYITAYLGRITNFITWIILIYTSIKLIPFGKKTLLFISLMPITLQEAVSLSPDALTFGVAVLLFSFVLNKAYNQKILQKKDYIFLSLLCIVISLCKIVYLPLCLLIILIPKENFENSKKKWKFVLSLAILVVFLNLLWLYFANKFLVFAHYNPDLQKAYILHNPLNFALIILRTVYYSGQPVVEGTFSHFLESFTVAMPYMTVYLNMIIFSILCYMEKSSKNYTNNALKIIIFLIIFSVFILINTSLYLQWTPTYAGMIEGIQGRYFLPILFLIPLLFTDTKKKLEYSNKREKENKNLYTYMMLQNVLAIILIIVEHI